MTEFIPTQMVACGYCYAISIGAPPHGEGQPCPMKVAAEVAYVGMLEAQQASYARSGFAQNDMIQILRKITGDDDDDD